MHLIIITPLKEYKSKSFSNEQIEDLGGSLEEVADTYHNVVMNSDTLQIETENGSWVVLGSNILENSIIEVVENP